MAIYTYKNSNGHMLTVYMYINGIQWPYHPIHMASIFFTYINILLYNYIYIVWDDICTWPELSSGPM